LEDTHNYRLHPEKNLDQFTLTTREDASLWLSSHLFHAIYKHIISDKMESLSGFYMILKVHKNPVAGRPICTAHLSVTSLASTLASKLLMVIHERLFTWVCNTRLKPFYLICLSTDEVIACTHKTHSTNPSGTSYFHSRNFESMYPNLNPSWCIDAILTLAQKYAGILSSREILVIFGRRHYQDFNPNIWRHLTSLRDE
jgi:hypothetical protein